jgi:hypothetical protein
MTMKPTFKTKHRQYIDSLENDPEFWAYDPSVRWADMVEKEQGPVMRADDGWTCVKKPPKMRRR